MILGICLKLVRCGHERRNSFPREIAGYFLLRSRSVGVPEPFVEKIMDRRLDLQGLEEVLKRYGQVDRGVGRHLRLAVPLGPRARPGPELKLNQHGLQGPRCPPFSERIDFHFLS